MTTRQGPLWTQARLKRVMTLRFGANRSGGVDTAAAAQAMGVHRSTIQRWLRATHGRSLAHIPTRRLEQLIALLTPSDETLAREKQQAEYAQKAIARMKLPRKTGIKPAWKTQRWTEPHTVMIIAIAHLGIRQVAVVRTDRLTEAKPHRRGRILDRTQVPTRFHATALTYEVLDQVGPWRFRAGHHQVTQGYTQAWLNDAPTARLVRVS